MYMHAYNPGHKSDKGWSYVLNHNDNVNSDAGSLNYLTDLPQGMFSPFIAGISLHSFTALPICTSQERGSTGSMGAWYSPHANPFSPWALPHDGS